MIGSLFTKQLQGADTEMEENMRVVKKTAVQAHEKAINKYCQLMGALDFWDTTVAQVEVLESNDQAAAATWVSSEEWGTREAARQVLKIQKF